MAAGGGACSPTAAPAWIHSPDDLALRPYSAAASVTVTLFGQPLNLLPVPGELGQGLRPAPIDGFAACDGPLSRRRLARRDGPGVRLTTPRALSCCPLDPDPQDAPQPCPCVRRPRAWDSRGVRKRILGYVRVSTDEHAAYGYGLDSKESKLREGCERRGWELAYVHATKGRAPRRSTAPG